MFRMFEVRMKAFLFTLLESVRCFFFFYFFLGEPTTKLGFPGWGKTCSCEEQGEILSWTNLDGAGT